jgi:hypothetical protein
MLQRVAIDVFGGVKPEPVCAEREPELRDRVHFLPDLGVIEVQVRHLRAEHPLISKPIARRVGGRVPAGAGTAGVRFDVKEAPSRRRGVVERLAEPRVEVGRVIERDVQDDAHAALVRLRGERLEVGERAVLRIDRPEVGHVIAMVRGRRKDGHQPEDAHLEVVVRRRFPVVQVRVEAADDSRQIADAARVVVAVSERAHEDLVQQVVRCRRLRPRRQRKGDEQREGERECAHGGLPGQETKPLTGN